MMTAMNMETGVSLDSLLDGLLDVDITAPVCISGLSLDSRHVEEGDLFFARAGSRVHAVNFIPQAVDAGAAAVIVENEEELEIPEVNVPVFRVDNFDLLTGQIADRFFNRPSSHVPVIGITGTNGKTSISWLLAHAMSAAETKTAMIGTLGIGLPNDLQESVNTTPDAITVHGSIAALKEKGTDAIAMEVSSHALQQQRVAGVQFSQAIFTNLSREHLDFHESMQAYAASKKRLFTEYQVKQRIINLDDDTGYELWQSLQSKESVYGYSLNQTETGRDDHIISGKILKNDLHGLHLNIQSPWGEHEIKSRLIGEFNASNLLVCFISMCLSGIRAEQVVAAIHGCPPVPGRMECFGQNETPLVIVDYAHTPDALYTVLKTLKQQTNGRLLCVFGCGGERDEGKRQEMGQAADHFADEIIVTNDNPRGEDPEKIIDAILSGIKREQHIAVEPDRSAAITAAIRQAAREDVVLIAGKGHESSQLINGQYLPFSDRNLVRACLEAW